MRLPHANDNEQGVAMLEVAILLPLVFLFVFGGLEYSRTLERSQWVSQLSREVANVTYRECAASTGPVLNACIRTKVLIPLTSQAHTLAPGTEFVVAVFSYDENDGSVTEEGIEGSQTYTGKFRDAGFTVQQLTSQAQAQTTGTPGMALRENRLIVVSTAYSPMQTFVRRIAPGISLIFPEVLVSSTVI